MKISIPKVTTPTTVKFLWRLDTGLGPYAGRPLQLIPMGEAKTSQAAILRTAVPINLVVPH